MHTFAASFPPANQLTSHRPPRPIPKQRQESFSRDWQAHVRDLAVLLHQHSRGAPVMHRLEHVSGGPLAGGALGRERTAPAANHPPTAPNRLHQSVREMGVMLAALLLFHPDTCMQLLYSDLETGAMGEPDRSVWDRTIVSMALNKQQVWWRARGLRAGAACGGGSTRTALLKQTAGCWGPCMCFLLH
jgi:hypothetical protein